MEGEGVSGCCRLIDGIDGPDGLTMMAVVVGLDCLMEIGVCRCELSDY
jgi:hypothetical protein